MNVEPQPRTRSGRFSSKPAADAPAVDIGLAEPETGDGPPDVVVVASVDGRSWWFLIRDAETGRVGCVHSETAGRRGSGTVHAYGRTFRPADGQPDGWSARRGTWADIGGERSIDVVKLGLEEIDDAGWAGLLEDVRDGYDYPDRLLRKAFDSLTEIARTGGR